VSDGALRQLDALRGRALALGLLGLGACGLGLLVHPEQVFRSWLFAFIFWITLSGPSRGIRSLP